MKKLALAALVTLATVGAFGQLPSGWVRLPNGEGVPKSTETARKNLVANKIAKLQEEGWLYQKWSDGTISYVGRFYMNEYGLIPTEANRLDVKFCLHGYKVYDVGRSGCRVAAYKSEYEDSISDNDFFVEGLDGVYTGRNYGTPVLFRKIGSYEYSTVNGSSRTIPKFECGEKATAQEYAAFLKRGTNTNTKTETESPKTNSPSLTTPATSTSTNSPGTFGPDDHGKKKNYRL